MPTTELSTQAAASRLTGATVRRPSQAPDAMQRAAETPSRTLDPTGRASESLSPRELTKAVDHLNALAQQVRRELRFSVDESSGRVVITVLDAESDEVVRQIPPEQVMSLVQTLQSAGGSLGVDVTA